MNNTNQAKSVLHFDNVYFRYSTGQTKLRPWLLENINLNVYNGDRIGIIGDNGSGKSTLAKLILGIYKPVKGKVNLFGNQVNWNYHYPDIGYIGDPGYNAEELGLPNGITVKQAIDLLASIYKNSEYRSRIYNIYELASSLDLKKLFSKDIKTLSTGERKRLMSCFALAKVPKLLILDEPTDGLDEHIKPVLKELIYELLGTEQITVIFISHNRTDIDTFTEKVYRVKDNGLSLEAQRRFSVVISCNGTVKEYKAKKLGQVQGIIEQVLVDNSVKTGFTLNVIPT